MEYFRFVYLAFALTLHILSAEWEGNIHLGAKRR